MASKQGKKKINWHIFIPIMFWGSCITFSFIKEIQSEKTSIKCFLDIINTNTFSTYVSMIICMLYQFFSNNTKKRQKGGLSRQNIAMTILSTVVYGICTVANAFMYNLFTTIVLLVVSLIYVFLFFTKMINN